MRISSVKLNVYRIGIVNPLFGNVGGYYIFEEKVSSAGLPISYPLTAKRRCKSNYASRAVRPISIDRNLDGSTA